LEIYYLSCSQGLFQSFLPTPFWIQKGHVHTLLSAFAASKTYLSITIFGFDKRSLIVSSKHSVSWGAAQKTVLAAPQITEHLEEARSLTFNKCNIY